MPKFDKVFIIHYTDYVLVPGPPADYKAVVRQHCVFGDTEENVRARFLNTPGFYGYESRIVKIESEPIEGSRHVVSFTM